MELADESMHAKFADELKEIGSPGGGGELRQGSDGLHALEEENGEGSCGS